MSSEDMGCGTDVESQVRAEQVVCFGCFGCMEVMSAGKLGCYCWGPAVVQARGGRLAIFRLGEEGSRGCFRIGKGRGPAVVQARAGEGIQDQSSGVYGVYS